MTDRLIIFTRYPVPGKTKTRLIHSLGEYGAAHLQEVMMGMMTLRAKSWSDSKSSTVQIQYTGADKKEFQQWLGGGLIYYPQKNGDLGSKMSDASESAFNTGSCKVVLIGCDCPGITKDLLDQAFAALNEHDVVLGPANDGGYYLIGMKRHLPHLFEGVDWGTETVLKTTQDIAAHHNLSVALIDTLTDIDNEEDLPVWEETHKAGEPNSISVVIPALNEENTIQAAVRSALTGADEVIVADGGSSDRTTDEAQSAGARVITAPHGRAFQMNAGALHASNEIIIFQHADTVLPEQYTSHVCNALNEPGVSIGAFSMRIHDKKKKYRIIEWGIRRRAFPYGDQALFMKRDTFIRLGGYFNHLLLEDIDLVKRAAKRGNVSVIRKHVLASPRRWQKLGTVRTTLVNQAILAGYALGVSPDTLAGYYYKAPKSKRNTAVQTESLT